MNRSLFSIGSIAAITVRRAHRNFYLFPNWPKYPFHNTRANNNIKEVCCTYSNFNCNLQTLVEAVKLTMNAIDIIFSIRCSTMS